MNWGYSLFMDQIGPNLFEWTFLANNKVEMPNLYFEDDLDPEFIPKLILRGPDGEEPYLWAKLGQIFLDWTFWQMNKIEMPSF